MMKRTGVRLAPDEPAPLPPQSPAQMQQVGASNMHTLAQSAQPSILGTAGLLSVGGRASAGCRSGSQGQPAVINYLKAPPHSAAPPQLQVQYAPKQQTLPRHKAPLPPMSAPLGRQSPGAPPPAPLPPGAPPGAQFQRLKVEDALSYLDQVKYKFNTQPQVYNDFLDIMKEFKSQTIDTPGVITRVSNLFKGHPELIVGFNTFLPPGYKIEVQSNGQVSVSMPSPTGLGGGGAVMMGVHHQSPQPPLVHLLPVPQNVNTNIVHNLSVPPAPANTLHHISQAHQQIEASMHHQSGTVQPGAGSGPHPTTAPPGQPVEFNHAIEYVNKIKSRFSRQPDKYKRFLEILHAYQRGHRELKEPQAKLQTEQEVYAQVAKLFENQEDLLAEFGQFLPDAKTVTKPSHCPPHPRTPPLPQRVENEPERFGAAPGPSPPPAPPHSMHTLPTQHLHHQQIPKHTGPVQSTTVATPPQHHPLKRSPSFTSSNQINVGGPPAKKSRSSALSGSSVRDVSYAEAAKFATLHEYNFFDKARKALRSQHVYDNFLRCLLLFTNEIISRSELLCVTAPFLCRHPELQKWLQDFLGPISPPHTPTSTVPSGFNTSSYNTTATNNTLLNFERAESKAVRYEPLGPPGAQLRHDRPQGDGAMDVDLTTCKRLGTSYCALPRDAAAVKCSGRTPLCKEVLNDTWVSFPTWSEDSTFVTSRKTQYEEYIYRCEDERFELDVVIETNAATIRVLEGVQKKLTRMTSEDAAKFRLDECLGGHSPTIHQRALRRIYGDKAVDIIAGLKKNPVVAVPVVLRRLKAKEEEWREAQKGFNKQWREQNEKYYLKSLDHQGINFKQNDLKALRSKSLFNEVEAAYAARRPGPHLVVDYNLKSRQEAIRIVRDAAELLIHHARRQTTIQKAEKRRIKQLLRHFLPDLFAHPRQPLSDDERDEEEKEEPASPSSPTGDHTMQDIDKKDNSVVKQEKESSESDNSSDKSGKNNKNDKENKPKNGNTADTKENVSLCANVAKHNSEESQTKSEVKLDADFEEDFKDYPPNEARFVCTSSWYLFLRLHGVLCQRLGAARRSANALAEQEAAETRQRPTSVATALRLKPNNLPADASSPSQYYSALLELVKGVLDGNTESSAYEDAAREMLGIKAYPAYTLDKLVSYAVRQLQHCVSEPWSVRAAELCARGGMRGPATYVRRAASYLRADHTAFLVRLYGGDNCRATFELLDGAPQSRASPHNNDGGRLSPNNQCRPMPPNNGSVSRVSAWSSYSEQFSRPRVRPDREVTTAMRARNKPVFLRRCARKGGAGTSRASNAASGDLPATEHSHAHRARRKPHRLHDHSECTLANTLRLVASRPHQMYRPGCLRAARASHGRLHAARRAKLRAWLRRQTLN